jgi:hypothetical protein
MGTTVRAPWAEELCAQAVWWCGGCHLEAVGAFPVHAATLWIPQLACAPVEHNRACLGV